MTKSKYENYTHAQLLEEVKRLSKRKKYGLVWEEEKTKEQFEEEGKLPVLVEDKKRAIKTDADKPTHILIEGDNYHALSVLNYTHAKSIDLIYIDPPYNTGNNDFKYNDRFVDKEDSYKHSKWLSFMNNRLKLAKKLLKDNGLIFISIDDVEIAQLKLLCDEIFLEEKLMGIIHWRKNRKPHNAAGTLSKSAEYILVYAKSIKRKLVQEYTIKDSNENGDFSESPIIKADKKERIYEFTKGMECQAESIEKGINTSARNPKLYIEYLDKPIIKSGVLKNTVRIKARYCVTNERGMLYDEMAKGNIFINKNGVPKLRTYREELLGKVANNLWYDKGYNEDASDEIKELFNVDLSSEIFDYAKPVKLIKEVAKCFNNKDAIILDFFAGTGTTGHAVLKLNNEDGGNRQFILCTNNENNICTEVCYPRINKVINGYTKPKGEKVEGLKENLKYYKTNFVGSEPTHRNKKLLTTKSVEMLCIKENTFEEVQNKAPIYIFKSKEKYTAILLDELKLADFKKKLRN